MKNYYGVRRLGELLLIVIIVALIAGREIVAAGLKGIIFVALTLLISSVYLFSTFKIKMSDDTMKLYSMFSRTTTVDLKKVDFIEFEGIDIRFRGRISKVYMTVWSEGSKITTHEVLSFSSRSFYGDLIRIASLNGFILKMDDDAKLLIEEYLD